MTTITVEIARAVSVRAARQRVPGEKRSLRGPITRLPPGRHRAEGRSGGSHEVVDGEVHIDPVLDHLDVDGVPEVEARRHRPELQHLAEAFAKVVELVV